LPQNPLAKLKRAANVYTFRDFILLPGRSEVEPREIDLSTRLTKKIRLSIPVVSSPMDTVTEWRMAAALARAGGVGIIHRNMSTEDQVSQLRKVKDSRIDPKSADEAGRPLVGAAVSPLDPERCRAVDSVADFLVCDVAHFHNSNVIKAAAKVLPDLSGDFIVGNVGTSVAVQDIISELPRVDGFRAGIGSGSVCLTSELTRVGAPTLYAVAEVATSLSSLKLDIPVIADGGIRSPGDATLALAAGASSLMLGSLLAGCDESPGPVVTVNGRGVKVHRGMASAAARKVRFALDRYSVPSKGVDEGVETYVPANGSTEQTIATFCDGLRAAFGYGGAGNIHDLWSLATFGLVSPQGSSELGAHLPLSPRGS
jgi:IMP dehydrogenase/GMP reductase